MAFRGGDEDLRIRQSVVDSFVDQVFADGEYQFKVVKSLGTGNTGYVFLAVEVRTNKFYAMKYIPYTIDEYPSTEEFLRGFGNREDLTTNEILCLRKLKPTCQRHFLCYVTDFDINEQGHVGKVIITEFLEGYVEWNLDQQTFEDRVWFFDILFQVIEELHAAGIAHNDIHTGNIFVDPIGRNIKLIDFGLCKPSITEDDIRLDWDRVGNMMRDYFYEDIERPEVKQLMELVPKRYIDPPMWDEEQLALIGII
jgi:serine/threonine protein kinase